VAKLDSPEVELDRSVDALVLHGTIHVLSDSRRATLMHGFEVEMARWEMQGRTVRVVQAASTHAKKTEPTKPLARSSPGVDAMLREWSD
jgi:hypothetical protein